MKSLIVFPIVITFILGLHQARAARTPANRSPAIPKTKTFDANKELTLEEELQFILNNSEGINQALEKEQDPATDLIEDRLNLGQSGFLKKSLSKEKQATLESIHQVERDEFPAPIHESDYLREIKPLKKLRQRSR